MSQSSATSLDRARHAIEARRTAAGGSAKTEIAKRSRKQTIQRKKMKKRRKDVEADLDTANLLERDGSDTFNKFRSCCNAPSKLKDSSGEFITYLGFEDRWQNDLEYRSWVTTSGYLPDKNTALHRDSQAALFFQDNFMSPHNPETTIK